MSPGRITIIYQLTERRSLARIDCRQCEHSVVVSAAIMERLFGRLENLDNAEKRARCTRCRGKGARISVIRPPRR